MSGGSSGNRGGGRGRGCGSRGGGARLRGGSFGLGRGAARDVVVVGSMVGSRVSSLVTPKGVVAARGAVRAALQAEESGVG